MFYPTFLESIDSYSRDGKSGEALLKDFSNYQVGTKVIFNLSSTAGNKDISHVMVDTSTGVETLVPKTGSTVATVLNGANESVENWGPQISGVVEFLNTSGVGLSQIKGDD